VCGVDVAAELGVSVEQVSRILRAVAPKKVARAMRARDRETRRARARDLVHS
jgi:transcription initiation factor IIE alpha subunit